VFRRDLIKRITEELKEGVAMGISRKECFRGNIRFRSHGKGI
jgi:hypothetical protein